MSIVATAESVRTKQTRAVVVADETLAAIEARDGDIHAFLHLDAESIRAQARGIDSQIDAGQHPGRLAGVPVAIKDNLCQRGVPTTCASKILEGWKPPYDATVITRLREAGAVLVGKTNLDEFAMGSSTENSAFGATKNPVDPSRVPGGSSGGSAAAVGADMVPVSLGSDTGGSIRQPAAFCGVVGLKPTYGTVSRYGLIAFASSLDQVGPFARSVDDAGVLFEVIAGHDPMDSTSLAISAPDVMTDIDGGVAGLRIGIIPELMDGSSDEVRARVVAAQDALREAGATLVSLPAPELLLGLAAYYLIAPAEASSNLARYDGVRYGNRVDGADVSAMMIATRTAGFGDEVKRRIMLGTYALSAGYYDAYYGQAQKVRTLIIETFHRIYQSCDLIVGATTPTIAFEFGSKTADPMSMYYSDIFTIPSNLAGHPAISVPFGTGEAGLPIGVQLLGPALSEPTLFRAAKFLETEVGR